MSSYSNKDSNPSIQSRIKFITENGKVARGKKELVAFLSGKRITLKQSLAAKCYDCMGYYDDGRGDCEVDTCPLYAHMPFSSLKKRIKEERKAERESDPSKARKGNPNLGKMKKLLTKQKEN